MDLNGVFRFVFRFSFCVFFGGPGDGFGGAGDRFFSTGSSSGLPLLLAILKPPPGAPKPAPGPPKPKKTCKILRFYKNA